METFSIGRDASNQIVLNDGFVSRKHAQLIITDNGQVIIKDSGSSNGTFVNDKRIDECYLKTGDAVKCASVLLNWQQYVSPAHIKTGKPVSVSPPVMVKAPNPDLIQENRNISSDLPDLALKSINEALAAQNQPVSNTYAAVQQNVVVVGKAKSVGVAFLLAFFFGPLGLLYASITGGIVMFIVYILVGIFTLGFGLLFVHPICIIWAIIAANQANAALRNNTGVMFNNNFQK